MLKVEYGSPADIEQWMDLVRLVRSNFPGLETEEALEEHRQTVLKFMGKDCWKKPWEKWTGVGILRYPPSGKTMKKELLPVPYTGSMVSVKLN